MREKAKDIYVGEVMSKDPKTAGPGMSAQAAAKLMRAENVGSLVIVEDHRTIGILTEKDFVEKLAAENRSAARVTVADIMTAPVVAIGPSESITSAARKMSEIKRHRLPVVENGQLVGILTENDILRISPSLIELTREWSSLGACGPTGMQSATVESGYCENCGMYSNELRMVDGNLLCAVCRETGPSE
ncbi:MAG TPA: CBS domain-containing protein [Methanomassiliicoccales archaeon]|nr:CBS domain-containing protein [Methanomassiliicoccales archaeon]